MNICVVTGANSGMGMVTIQELLERGDRVIATVRSQKKATLLIQLLREHAVSDANLEVEIVQLDQLDSYGVLQMCCLTGLVGSIA